MSTPDLESHAFDDLYIIHQLRTKQMRDSWLDQLADKQSAAANVSTPRAQRQSELKLKKCRAARLLVQY
jgi:hypothetical protein